MQKRTSVHKSRAKSPKNLKNPYPAEDGLPGSLGHTMLALRVSPPQGAEKVLEAETVVMRQEDLAAVLQRTPGRPGKGKRKGQQLKGPASKVAAFTGRMVGEMEMPKHFDVWKIARYANWSGVPVSVIMLVQELGAHLRDGDVDLARAIAEAAGVLCAKVAREAGRLSNVEGDGPGEGLTAEGKAAFLEECRSGRRKPLAEKDERLLLIVDELFRTYPETALRAKRAEAAKKRARPGN